MGLEPQAQFGNIIEVIRGWPPQLAMMALEPLSLGGTGSFANPEFLCQSVLSLHDVSCKLRVAMPWGDKKGPERQRDVLWVKTFINRGQMRTGARASWGQDEPLPQPAFHFYKC